MGNGVVAYTHNKILLIHKNQANPTIYTKWKELEDLMLSEINWTESQIYMIPLMWNLKKTKKQGHRKIGCGYQRRRMRRGEIEGRWSKLQIYRYDY